MKSQGNANERFDPADAQPVHFFMLRLAPTEELRLVLEDAHTKLANLWSDKALRSKLLAATSAEELIALILEGVRKTR